MAKQTRKEGGYLGNGGAVEEQGRPCPKLTFNVVTIPLDDNCLERIVRIGKDLDPFMRDDIVRLLGQYKEVFTFDSFEMPGIAPDIVQPRLNVNPSHKPIIQTIRNLGTKRSVAVAAEVKKLLEDEFIRKCQYDSTLSGYRMLF